MVSTTLNAFRIVGEKGAPEPAALPGRPSYFSVTGLSVSYNGRAALRDVTLTIPERSITAIVGPSGCGKSTFLSCLNRLDEMTPGCMVDGRIIADGQDIHASTVDLGALRKQIGMIFQRPNPFPLSIRANLTFALRHHGLHDRARLEHEVETALQAVGLWAEVKDRLDAPALGLSGGQQQRLCLARALALQPAALLLDEPCSALDPIASGVVEDLIASLGQRYTVVIVTHNLAQARRIADEVAVFWSSGEGGWLAEHGATRAVFEAPQTQIAQHYISGSRG